MKDDYKSKLSLYSPRKVLEIAEEEGKVAPRDLQNRWGYSLSVSA